MIERRRGKIIMISSLAGSVALPQRAAYCSSKGALNMFTKTPAMEWAPYHITVNCIAPTYVKTPLTEPMFADEQFKEWVLGNIPLGRIGRPEDVSGALIYLASEASNLVTGAILAVDGGWTSR